VTDTAARLYFDHDADARLAEALRRRGFDVVTALQAGPSEADDDAQLAYATESGRIFVTHNVHHFPGIHAAWLADGRSHPGIIILIGYPQIGVWLRRMLGLLTTFDASNLRNQLIYLGPDFD
jgi:hypothetical protein